MTGTMSFTNDDPVYLASVCEGSSSNGAAVVRSVESAILPNTLNEAIAASAIA